MPIFALSLLEYVSTFQKKQCLKICLILVLLASYWPTSKSHPKIAVRWRAFGCLRRPWNFDEDAGCMHQAHEIGIKRGASIFWAADGGCGCFLFLFGCLPDRLLCFGLRCLVLCCHVLGCLFFFLLTVFVYLRVFAGIHANILVINVLVLSWCWRWRWCGLQITMQDWWWLCCWLLQQMMTMMLIPSLSSSHGMVHPHTTSY